jgi:hypothetical protein
MKHNIRSLFRWLQIIAVTGFMIIFCAGALYAQNIPKVGSNNVATADPPVPRLNTKPCIVVLFPKQNFGKKGNDANMGAKPHRFRYTPPADCKGPWAKVVLEANFSVDHGIQYDRTASIWLNGVNLYFGTTQEPSPTVSPHWQVQRDLTDYSSLFSSPGSGITWINNWIDSTRSSMIHASARLLFYPADSKFPAPKVPDKIYALNGKSTTPANLKKSTDALSRSITFPKNTTRVYLDVFAQPQHNDEFYYYRGSNSFREVEISVDDRPAGLAPVTPWVFTGGIDPFLWRPTPGNNTLNFMPYRVDLTPFAGFLSNGKQHKISVRVLGANNYFSVAAALLVYQDKNANHTGGNVTLNTLQSVIPEPTVTNTLGGDSTSETNNRNVQTRAEQNYVIEGYVNTSRGRVQTIVKNDINFVNIQQSEKSKDKTRHHIVNQAAHVESTSKSTGKRSKSRSLKREIGYLLSINTSRGAQNSKDHRERTVTVHQNFKKHIVQSENGLPLYQAHIRNTHAGSDHVSYNPNDRRSFKHKGQTSKQNYVFWNSLGDCYQAEVQARDSKVTNFTKGQGCIDGKPSIHWFVHPDGSPGSFGWRGNYKR